jgi:malonate transporter
VFGLTAIGFVAARLDAVTAGGLQALRFFVFYLALPALIFQLVSTAPLAGVNLFAFALTTTFATYCAFAIAFSVAALLNRGHVPESTIEGLVGAHAEVPLMGAALAIAAFGSVAAAPMAVILAVDGAMLAALTPLMMALGQSGRSDPMTLAVDIARRVFLNPLLLAAFAGIIAAALAFRLPGPLDGLLTLLRQAAAAVALFTLGAALPFRPLIAIEPEVPGLIIVKLVGHPLIVYLLLSWVGGFNRVWVSTAVLMAALPPTAHVVRLARENGIPTDRIEMTILFATIGSIATVTIVLVLLLNGVLPVR